MVQWFISHQEETFGPLLAEEVVDMISEGTLPPTALVWGAPLEGWKPFGWWKANLDSILERATKKPDRRLWHYALNGDTFGPLERSELIEKLQVLDGDANDALIWTKGMKTWAPIYEFHDIMDEVGVNRRHFPRAPVQGKVVLHHGEDVFNGNLISISEGGFGVSHFPYDLSPGLSVKVEIKCDQLGGSIYAIAQLRYLDDNSIGFKFTNINQESLSQIITYVKDKSFEMISQLDKVA